MHVLFWIKSSRGTNCLVVKQLPDKVNQSEIKSELETWCKNFGAWHISENACSYGFRKITIPPRKTLRCQYDQVCKQKQRIHDRWAVLAAMLQPGISVRP